MRPHDPFLRGGKKVAATLPTPLPRRSLSSASGGGTLSLEAVSCSRSTRLLLVVSVESDSLQQHSVTLIGGLWITEQATRSWEECTPGSASAVEARNHWRRLGDCGLARSVGPTLLLRPRPPVGSTLAQGGWCPSAHPSRQRHLHRRDLGGKASPPPGLGFLSGWEGGRVGARPY